MPSCDADSARLPSSPPPATPLPLLLLMLGWWPGTRCVLLLR